MHNIIYERMRNILLIRGIEWEEKRMMGGLTFMVDGKMCFGALNGGILCRIDPEEREELLRKPGADIMTQGGREMKGYVHVQPEGFEADQDLQFWVDQCLAFNPKAKASKRKKKD
ncbi:MAG: TfoX/Sxy family protein [Bacteroidota bacterium]